MPNPRLWVSAALLLVSVVLLAGCGGHGGGQPTGSVTGRVTDAAGLDPGTLVVSVQGTDITGSVNPDGTFAINGVPAGDQTVTVTSPDGSYAAHIGVTVPDGGTISAGEFRLLHAGQIAGLVTTQTEDGGLLPVPGAVVIAVPQDEPIILDPGQNEGGGDGTEPSEPPLFQLITHTDEFGSYVLRGVPPGQYEVSVHHPDFQPASQMVFVEAGHTSVADFTLVHEGQPDLGLVVGTVRERLADGAAGRPLADVAIVAWPAELFMGNEQLLQDWPPLPPDGSLPNVVFTDELGHYSMRLPAGQYVLVAKKPDYEPAHQMVTIVAGEHTVADFLLTPIPPPPIQVVATTDKAEYAQGEPVHMVLEATNISQEPITLHFPVEREYDFLIFFQDRLVWHVGPVDPGTGEHDVTLEPHQTLRYEATWDQTTLWGDPAPPGPYHMVGALLSMRPHMAEPVTFDIIGPPPPPLGGR